MNNIIVLKGTDYENDKKAIEENINSDAVFILEDDNAKLYQYIDTLYNDYSLSNEYITRMRICKQLDFYGKVTLYAENGVKIDEPGTTEEVMKLTESGTKYKLIIEDERGSGDDKKKRKEGHDLLANIAQQFIFIDYPLPEIDFKLRSEYKDADKTARFIERIENLRQAAHSASNVIANIVIDNPDIDEESREKLLETRQSALDSYKEISEQIHKAIYDVEMKIAVAATKKTGKSVIVNCMLETELAPTSLQMATPNTCIYKRSEDDSYHLTLRKDGREEREDFNDPHPLYKKISGIFKEAESNKEAGYACPDMLIEYVNNGNNFNSFTIFDTPGPDLAGAAHYKSAEKAINECDVSIFALDYSKHLTNDENKFFKEVKTVFDDKNKFHTLIFVLNKMDLALGDYKDLQSRVYAIDYIKNRMGEINPEYSNCIVFGTSAQDYFYTVELEDAIKNNSALTPLKTANLYDDVNKYKRELPSGNQKTLLTKIGNEANNLADQLGYKEVTLKDLQMFSGIPQLIDYVTYIATSKAREEIVNSITYKIDEQSRKLAEIVKEIPNIEKLMGKNKEEIEKIADILREYSDAAAEILNTNELSAQDGRSIYSKGITAAEINSLGGYPVAINKIVSELCRDIGYLSEADVEKAVWREFLKSYKNEIANLNGKIVPLHELNEIAKRLLVEALGDYRDRTVAEGISKEQNRLQEFKNDLQSILAARQKRLEEISDVCRQKLKKENCPLELPEIPSFNVSIPDKIVTDLEKFEIQVRFADMNGGFYNKLWPIHKFFRNLFTHKDLFYDGNDVTVEGAFTTRDEEKLKNSMRSAIKDADVAKKISEKDLGVLAESVEEAADKVCAQFAKMNNESGKRIKKFSELVDDTDFFLKKQEGFERLKTLIGNIDEASKGFMEIWNFVLTDAREEG